MEEEDMDMFMNDIDMITEYELDFQYEFDAATYFDFTKPESKFEARVAELWFESAPDYHPSPFAVKLFPLKGLYLHNDDDLSMSGNDDNMSSVNDEADINQQQKICYQDEAYQEKKSRVLRNANSSSHDSQKQAGCLFEGQATGSSFYNQLANDMKKAKVKALVKPYIPKSSTLMKPTASQLAKLNQRRTDVSPHCGTESQASKRQKLDKGLSRKIVDMKRPTTPTRKNPKKDVAPQGMDSQSKLRITIPREPVLETAHRADRIRCMGNKEVEKPTSTFSRFKARPLNKKILEAPVCTAPKRNTPHVQDFQAFRFKATEQTKQFAFTAMPTAPRNTTKGSGKANPGSILETVNKARRRYESADASKSAERQLADSFKAHSLDRKIMTSGGDLGIFRNNKREATATKGFEFQRSKKNVQDPLTELFSKLSLAGEP
ncbi:hypothetical protein vseg_020268 [Gypsophila vaccaria]